MNGPPSSPQPTAGRRILGGKELLTQQQRVKKQKQGEDQEEMPLSDEDDYTREESDQATVDGGDTVPPLLRDTPPATPTRGRRRTASFSQQGPGRVQRSRRSASSSWGSSLGATSTAAKKGAAGSVREGPYDSFSNSPVSPVAVRNLDDRFGRCEPSKQQSKYFTEDQMSTADSALNLMNQARGRGQRFRHRGSGLGPTGTPHRPNKRPPAGQEANENDRGAWDRVETGRNNSYGIFSQTKRRRNGIDKAAERAKANVAAGLRNLGNTW